MGGTGGVPIPFPFAAAPWSSSGVVSSSSGNDPISPDDGDVTAVPRGPRAAYIVPEAPLVAVGEVTSG